MVVDICRLCKQNGPTLVKTGAFAIHLPTAMGFQMTFMRIRRRVPPAVLLKAVSSTVFGSLRQEFVVFYPNCIEHIQVQS